MNKKKVIGSLIFLFGALLIGTSTDDWKDGMLLYFGILGMIAGWDLADG